MNEGLRCSFCGKTKEQARLLIAGVEAFICDECVELCGKIVAEHLPFDGKWGASCAGDSAAHGAGEVSTPRQPIRWKVFGLATMTSAGIALAADLLAAAALNFGRVEAVGEGPLRWIAVACIAVAATGASVAACAEWRGAP